jgi:hypothetical protein
MRLSSLPYLIRRAMWPLINARLSTCSCADIVPHRIDYGHGAFTSALVPLIQQAWTQSGDSSHDDERLTPSPAAVADSASSDIRKYVSPAA